ncbi:hypothetical protein NRP93_002206 [Clostridium botulinum]|nr:hypothetical protein [Clostridium botulinum]
MNFEESYIFKDLYGNMYEFYINEDNTLMCNKFSEETKILENVSQFNINVTPLGIIEIVCITFDGFIKYCKFNKKWTVQILYKLKSHNSIIDEVTLFSKGNKLHIFFMFYENKYDSIANILHYIWNGKKFKTNIIGPINTIENIDNHYHLEILNNTINMFYITKEKNSNVINSCRCLNDNTWTTAKKLYRLNGNNVNFSTLNKDKQFNILNISKENGLYTLEHVVLDTKDNIKNLPIYKTKNPIYKSTFIISNNILYCVWLENNMLMYSSFNNAEWSNCSNINTEAFDNIHMYGYIYEESPLDNSIKSKNIFASISDNINIFLPKITKTHNKINEKYDAESTIRKLLQEISKKNTVNYDLQNKTILLTENLKEKNIHVNNLMERLNKISIQKSTIEKKYKSLLDHNDKLNIEIKEFKQKINKEYEQNKFLKTQLEEKTNENEKFDKKMEENNSLNKNLENVIEKLQNENVTAIKNVENKYIKEIKDIKNQLKDKEDKFKSLLDKNKNLEKSIEELKLENNNVKEKEKNFEYIADYSQKLEATLKELKSENSLIKQQLESSKNKNFIEKIFGNPYK